MAYPEKRSGRLTGRWYGEIQHKGKRFRDVFDTKRDAEGYEAYVKATGYAPAGGDTAKHASGSTFREVALECKAAGGPRACWKNGFPPPSAAFANRRILRSVM
jgi:hypothetical protein